MEKTMKKMFVCAVLGLGFALNLEAQTQQQLQQVTRFAVVDLTRVYNTFYGASRAVRDLEAESARVQAEINRRTAEIQELKNAKLAADGRGDREQSLKLDNEIYEKSESLKEYYRVKTAELEDKRAKLSQSGAFLEQVRVAIRRIAETEGYSMVLRVSDNADILWYSRSVDITDKVIERLRAR
jgi:outer membrane protein